MSDKRRSQTGQLPNQLDVICPTARETPHEGEIAEDVPFPNPSRAELTVLSVASPIAGG